MLPASETVRFRSVIDIIFFKFTILTFIFLLGSYMELPYYVFHDGISPDGLCVILFLRYKLD